MLLFIVLQEIPNPQSISDLFDQVPVVQVISFNISSEMINYDLLFLINFLYFFYRANLLQSKCWIDWPLWRLMHLIL